MKLVYAYHVAIGALPLFLCRNNYCKFCFCFYNNEWSRHVWHVVGRGSWVWEESGPLGPVWIRHCTLH